LGFSTYEVGVAIRVFIRYSYFRVLVERRMKNLRIYPSGFVRADVVPKMISSGAT